MSLIMKRAIQIRGRGEARFDGITLEWSVKSQSQAGVWHRVTIDPISCECPYWRNQDVNDRLACAHILAAKLEWGRINRVDDPVLPKYRRSYPNAPWYEKVCQIEYRAVREMLRCLGARFPYLPPDAQGRPPVCYGDLLVVGGLARYDDDSSRFAIRDPAMLLQGGYLQGTRVPKPSTLRDHMRTDEMTAMNRTVFDLTADAVRHETEFVTDSTFIRSSNYELIYERMALHGRMRWKATNIKLNFASGLRTHVLTGVMVVNENVSDQVLFIPTLQQFWDRFRLDVVFADAGYDSVEHYEAVAARGGIAMIDFRDLEKRQMQGMPHHDEQLIRRREFPDEWLAEYHKRNLAETLNSVFKRTIANGLRNRYFECLVNEAMMHCIVYNLIRLLHARYEFGLAIPFADERAMRVIDDLPDIVSA